MRLATGAVLLCAALLVAGCTSSKSGAGSTPSVPVTPSSPAATSTTPTPTPTHTTAKPKPKPKPSPPLSRYEADPAVAAYRGWMAEAARTVNTGHYDSRALRALMTAGVASTMQQTLGSDVGLHYPGPIPFTPVSVRANNANMRTVRACAVGTGFAQNPKTGRPAKPLSIIPVTAQFTRTGSRWLLSSQLTSTDFSCKGVTVKMPKW